MKLDSKTPENGDEDKDKAKGESPLSLLSRKTRKAEESMKNMQMCAMLCKNMTRANG